MRSSWRHKKIFQEIEILFFKNFDKVEQFSQVSILAC